MAFKFVGEWVYLDQASSPASTAASCVVDDFGVQKTLGRGGEKVVFELHSHSKCSDGFLSPSKLVERGHGNGVQENLQGAKKEFGKSEDDLGSLQSVGQSIGEVLRPLDYERCE
ncbi:uncharacterized protein LOC133715595 [Rosa rugosa]|uniref:uncharacterized protein LOC133715595 n=1 Tax=Rosa rugosa TaxID=74645 RepID=UPI002B409F14|nr:uncharacterized protein LOC133715595 [Rosa rugosa]